MIGLVPIGLRLLAGARRFVGSPVGSLVVLAAVALTIMLVHGQVKYREGRDAGRAEVQDTIDRPLTGWAARLAQCQANTGVLQTAIDGQNAAIEAAARESADKLKAATRDLEAAQRANRKVPAAVARVLEPQTGGDTCSRLMEADRRFLETVR